MHFFHWIINVLDFSQMWRVYVSTDHLIGVIFHLSDLIVSLDLSLDRTWEVKMYASCGEPYIFNDENTSSQTRSTERKLASGREGSGIWGEFGCISHGLPMIRYKKNR